MKFIYQNHEFELSTSHAASSYGIPILIHNSKVYGRDDFPALGGDFSFFDAGMIVSYAFNDLDSRPPEVCAFLGR